MPDPDLLHVCGVEGFFSQSIVNPSILLAKSFVKKPHDFYDIQHINISPSI